MDDLEGAAAAVARGIDDLGGLATGVARKKNIVGGDRRVSSGGSRAMTSLGRTRGLTKDENELMPRHLWWMVGDDGRPESLARRSSSVHGAFPGAGE